MPTKTFSEIITFTRASEATYYDAQGVLRTAAVDEPRLTYDPETGESLGLLIEEDRTRLNTIAAEPTDPEDVTVTSEAHTISFFGTGTVDLTGVATEALGGTGADERVSLTFTPTAGTLTITPSGTVENLQLEEGSFATSAILGEGSQVTREADNASVKELSGWFNGCEGTIYTEVEDANTEGRTSYFSTGSTVTGEAFGVGRVNDNIRASVNDFNGVGNDLSVPSEPGKMKIAFSWSPQLLSISLNGGAAVTTGPPTVVLKPESIGLLPFWGTGGVGSFKSGVVKFLPRALSATELEALTAP